MKTYKFLFSSRWLGYFALALVFAMACVALGNWQMNRRNAVVENITKIQQNYSGEDCGLRRRWPATLMSWTRPGNGPRCA